MTPTHLLALAAQYTGPITYCPTVALAPVPQSTYFDTHPANTHTLKLSTPGQPQTTKVIRHRHDPRTLEYVLPYNPKRPGSKAHANWPLYEVNITLSALYRRGLTPTDIRWDLRHGHIRLAQP